MIDKDYTLKDIAEALNVSERTARRYIDELINSTETIKRNKYRFNSVVYNAIILTKKGQSFDNNLTDFDKDDNGLITETFEVDQYEMLNKVITEYPILKEQINYLKEQIEKNREEYRIQLSIFKTLVNSVEQRNFIEAKEKKFDN